MFRGRGMAEFVINYSSRDWSRFREMFSVNSSPHVSGSTAWANLLDLRKSLLLWLTVRTDCMFVYEMHVPSASLYVPPPPNPRGKNRPNTSVHPPGKSVSGCWNSSRFLIWTLHALQALQALHKDNRGGLQRCYFHVNVWAIRAWQGLRAWITALWAYSQVVVFFFLVFLINFFIRTWIVFSLGHRGTLSLCGGYECTVKE